ncbi:STE/STE11 protein kinase [Coprinopsis cinerea okayama7|uniref:STE/STE11 protein kinase n=1 Tax=Coprinopsis cinerea (strain Okayama-7 / 130 / ATCC MYA-4618 / FGSC 9003) TaxID=240176 RepID=A8N1A3_COPC7|nr:STE/STE11 protein kinase [Coprinopsis cinerea okayama7\|eukprot:XP_001828652.2 STE/STE11 protein kinase [Coprinopsis cinerea okayama7\
MDSRPASTLRTLQTWAVPFRETVPPVPDLPGRLLPQPSSSPHNSALDNAPDYSDSDDDDSIWQARPRERQPRRSSGQRLPYQRSFVKPTFQWIRGELLGKGSYGRVYLALNATTGEVMAVKQVELPKTPSDKMKPQQLDVMKALKFEGDTLKDLDHPNIVSYLGFEESQDYLSIFLEYVPGGTVGSLLVKNGRLREEVTKSWLRQILQGLDYLHGKGILHRDLKADNILVDHSGVCKISDFGISKKAGEINRAKAHTGMKGTSFWMAPEILSPGEKGYDVKVDIWSVGCVAVEMWTGKRPWYGHEWWPVLMKVAEDKSPPPIPEDIPMGHLAQSFHNQCFRPDPADRPHASVMLKHPYLEIQSPWVFNWDDLADNSRPPRIYPELVPPVVRERTVTQSTFKANGPPTEKPRAHKPPLEPLKIPAYGPTSTQRKPSVNGAGPPVVWITPPNTPRRTAKPEDSSASTSTSDAAPWKSTSKRRLVIVNPDLDDDIGPAPQNTPPKPKFVYTPPPLPDPPQPPYASSPRPLRHAVSTSFASVSSMGSISSKAGSPSRPRALVDPGLSSTRTPPRPLPNPLSPPLGRSPAPLPVLPSPSKRRGSSRDRSHTVHTTFDASASKLYEEGNPTAKASVHNLPISSSGSRTIRRLPISPQQLNHGRPATTTTPSMPGSSTPRPLRPQKSVPDVSIFAFSRDAYHSRHHPSFKSKSNRPLYTSRGSFDSEPEDINGASDNDSVSSTSTTHTKHPQRGESLLAMRPRTEDVYKDLEAWFPNHDLDRPVDGADTPASGALEPRHHRVDVRKSIRMIAKEQNRRSHNDPASSRRRTMLWNTHMEELSSDKRKDSMPRF